MKNEQPISTLFATRLLGKQAKSKEYLRASRKHGAPTTEKTAFVVAGWKKEKRMMTIATHTESNEFVLEPLTDWWGMYFDVLLNSLKAEKTS